MRTLSFLPLAALAAACGGNGDTAPPLRLVEVRPPPGSTLLLNEDVRLTFSEAVDPASVTGASVRVVGLDGAVARGRWHVRGRVLRYEPREVLARDLSDGGWQPGGRYRVELAGFPRAAALRATDGSILERGMAIEFAVVEVGEDQLGFVFEDASPGHGSPLRQLPGDPGTPGRPLAPGAPLRLVCAEPLDPTSLVDDELVVVPEGQPDRRIPVQLRLVRNRDEDDDGDPRARAVLLVQPTEELEPMRRYLLRSAGTRRPSLRDLHDNPVWRGDVGFEVGPLHADDTEERGVYELEFLDDSDAVPVDVPWADGTARWGEDGVLAVPFPAAAGSGRDGAVELRGPTALGDVEATSLTIPADATARLDAEGLVVLRAQGRVTLRGRLHRRASVPPAPMWRWPEDDLPSPTALSAWLAAAAERGDAWTVVVAGGDLVVDGELEVDTPLLLVAGGRLRGRGAVRAAPGQLWELGEGASFATEDPPRGPNPRAPLLVDAPATNVLARPLVYAAVSSPVPKGAVPAVWTEATAIGHEGHGRFVVRYLPADVLAPGAPPLAREASVSSPNLLPAGPVRVLLELEVFAAPAGGVREQRWDPPHVDRVRLAWRPER